MFFRKRKPAPLPRRTPLAAVGSVDLPDAAAYLGEVATFSCDFSSGDSLDVQRTGLVGDAHVHLIARDEDGTDASVLVTPSHARQIAAAILNAADEADGTAPLPSRGTDLDPPVPA